MYRHFLHPYLRHREHSENRGIERGGLERESFHQDVGVRTLAITKLFGTLERR
jgi:hypothetical protein